MLFVRGAVGVLFVWGAVGVLFVGGAVGVARSLVIAVLPGPHLPQGCIRASKVALGFLNQKVARRTLSVPSPSGCANTKGGAGRVMAEVVPLRWTAPLLFGMTCQCREFKIAFMAIAMRNSAVHCAHNTNPGPHQRRQA